MNKILVVLCFVLAAIAMAATFPEGAAAVLLLAICATAAVIVIRRNVEDSDFLVNIFLVALIARILFATVSYIFKLHGFFGEDSATYDEFANELVRMWTGLSPGTEAVSFRASSTSLPGWGMNYLIGFLYLLCGRNMLAGQYLCSVIGAATAPMVYVCAYEIYHNRRVSQITAILVALFPAFIVWSSLLLKDGIIIFLLALAMTMTLKLQKKFSYNAVAFLCLAMFGILAFRFYIFYVVAVAVTGSFIIGSGSSLKAIIRGFVLLMLVGGVLTYIGALQNASNNLEKFGSLERLQASRQDYSRSNSGFGEDLDVSTPTGALRAMPIGFTYLMLAPFPWEISNVRQAITLPEMLLWWSLIPILLSGLWFTLRTKVRNAIPILLFSSLLTLGYSVFQGNVGTAYRQRAQIQLFLFMFIGVGITMIIERRENRKLLKRVKHHHRSHFDDSVPPRELPANDDTSGDKENKCAEL